MFLSSRRKSSENESKQSQSQLKINNEILISRKRRDEKILRENSKIVSLPSILSPKDRITNIYENVLSKVGKEYAYEIFNTYFKSSHSEEDYKQVINRMFEKEEAEKKSHINEQIIWRENKGHICKRKDKISLTPLKNKGKKEKCEKYRKWYLLS